MNKKTLFIAQAAVIAALYVVLTLAISVFNLASGAIQVRVSEALTILPYFTPAAIPGLFVGCILANLLTPGSLPLDAVFGSIATLLGALGTWAITKASLPDAAKKWTAPLPPILANMLIIPWVLRLVYAVPDGIPFLMLTVGIGEMISCGILGMILLYALNPKKMYIFGSQT